MKLKRKFLRIKWVTDTCLAACKYLPSGSVRRHVEGEDLKGEVPKDVRYPGIRFPRVMLPKVNFPRVRLPRMRFSRVRLLKVKFPRMRLRRVSFPRMRFLRVRLRPRRPHPQRRRNNRAKGVTGGSNLTWW